jgi:pimeloyl-ACP methyl ester carboxylesterase
MITVGSTEIASALGHELVGSGPLHVMVTNDWLCDTSTWDSARQYLDTERFTFAFADLRGYGRSRGRAGSFNVEEASSDVLELADALGWRRFVMVGHSMSSLVALHLAQRHADRLHRVVVLTPPPPGGFGADDERLSATMALARADETTRMNFITGRSEFRLSSGWARYKAARWRASADDDAAAAYVRMFARDGVPNPTARIDIPVLAITGEQDAPIMRRDSVTRLLAPLCDQLVVTALLQCGHYPMQEMPVLTVALIEEFVAG